MCTFLCTYVWLCMRLLVHGTDRAEKLLDTWIKWERREEKGYNEGGDVKVSDEERPEDNHSVLQIVV